MEGPPGLASAARAPPRDRGRPAGAAPAGPARPGGCPMKIRMKVRTILSMWAVALAFATGGREAAADHVFQLVDVMFQSPPFGPGGTATGTFTTNDAITALVTYDITTSSVVGFPGFEYTPVTAP